MLLAFAGSMLSLTSVGSSCLADGWRSSWTLTEPRTGAKRPRKPVSGSRRKGNAGRPSLADKLAATMCRLEAHGEFGEIISDADD